MISEGYGLVIQLAEKNPKYMRVYTNNIIIITHLTEEDPRSSLNFNNGCAKTRLKIVKILVSIYMS